MLQSVSKIPYTANTHDETETLRILNAFAVDVMSIPNAEDLFWYVAQNVVGKLSFVDCVIYKADQDQTELTQVAALGEKNPFGRSILNPMKIPFGQGITGRVAQNREAIIVDDLLLDQSYIADTQPARSEICVPMIYRNRIVGVIDSEHPDSNAFGQDELDVLTTVAAMTSAKLELLEESERSRNRYQELVASHDKLTQEVNNRKVLEAKLFESRKLEAIGRLTGGFAHDFNNLLTVICGNLELVGAIVDNPDVQSCIEAAEDASGRAAQLIQNMLSFAQRARLEPTRIDLNTILQAMDPWARNHLTDTISLDIQSDDNLWPIQADQTATENALFNLVVNARDAMPKGGLLKITAENKHLSIHKVRDLGLELSAGAYVCLSVQDNGVGIPEDRLAQIFDPFFTTKKVGAGTGLGLSMIMGFMQQSGGAVVAESNLGRGSQFKLFFPAQLSDA